MNQGLTSAHLEMSRTVGPRDEGACESQPPVVVQMVAIQNELSYMDQLVGMLYARLGPITLFEPQCAEKDDGSKLGGMCDLEAALHARLMHIRENNRKLNALIGAIQI